MLGLPKRRGSDVNGRIFDVAFYGFEWMTSRFPKILTFYTKYIRLSPAYAYRKVKVFQNEIKFENFNFNTFKGFLILTKLF